MPTYEYEDRKGNRIERFYEAGKAPSELCSHGKYYTRVFSSQAVAKRTVHNLVSNALPLNWPYANRHDEKGRPVFSGRSEISECVTRANANGEPVVYDD